jgi:CRP-like cAMP-binding protein
MTPIAGIDAPTPGHSPKPRILVVEDNYLTAKAVCDIVRDCGFSVAGAVARLESGLDFLAERDIDGAIVDINLDGTQSFPLCAELNRRKVPFCFLTGYAPSIIPPAFRSAPLLSKPFDPGQMKLALTGLAPHRAPAAPAEVDSGRGNALLQTLTDEDWRLLESCLERVSLRAGEVLESPADPVTHVTFPTSGLVSVAARAADHRIEAALVGREGVVGAAALLEGGTAANESVVQFPGEAWRVPVSRLRPRLAQSRALQSQLLCYVHAFMGQISLNLLATGRATIEQRLARWLLMAADRLQANDIAVTHEALAYVLGVRRAGVTVALHTLEGRQALRSERRRVRILDRSLMVAAAGGFYGAAEDLYQRLVEPAA